eukprot:662679-Amphidinium_carterae.1
MGARLRSKCFRVRTGCDGIGIVTSSLAFLGGSSCVAAAGQSNIYLEAYQRRGGSVAEACQSQIVLEGRS